MENIKLFFGTLLAVVAMSIFISWTNHHDAEMNQWAEKYETCVKSEYHTTPTEYRNQNGVYPECDTK